MVVVFRQRCRATPRLISRRPASFIINLSTSGNLQFRRTATIIFLRRQSDAVSSCAWWRATRVSRQHRRIIARSFYPIYSKADKIIRMTVVGVVLLCDPRFARINCFQLNETPVGHEISLSAGPCKLTLRQLGRVFSSRPLEQRKTTFPWRLRRGPHGTFEDGNKFHHEIVLTTVCSSDSKRNINVGILKSRPKTSNWNSISYCVNYIRIAYFTREFNSKFVLRLLRLDQDRRAFNRRTVEWLWVQSPDEIIGQCAL